MTFNFIVYWSTNMSRNIKKENEISLVDKMDEIDKKLAELEKRLDELLVKIDQIQQGSNRSTPELTSSQVRIIRYMQGASEGSTMKEIRSNTGLAKATVSTGLRDLMKIGSVQKAPATTNDARYKYFLVGEVPPKIRKMLELFKDEPER